MYKLKDKTIIVLFVCACLIFAADPKSLRQVVRNWPTDYDATGAHWFTYDLADCENRVNTEDTSDCFTEYVPDLILWTSQLAKFGDNPSWGQGDSILSFGSWDSAYATSPSTYDSNSNHTGFYWLFTDTLNPADPQDWRDDTLRVLPKPNVYKTGIGGGANDTIWVEIPNPRETRYTGQTVYDVLGYWLWADSTGTGTPNAFDAASAMEIGFIPVDGVYGNTTVYWQLESEDFLAWDHWTTYFAYKLVARPDTTGSENPGSPGYATYYFSQNSDAIDVYQIVIGIEENKDINHSSMQLEISPNPFTDRTDIKCSMGQSAKGTELKIYDISGKLVKDFSHFTLDALRPTLLSWYGTDESGELLPSGVYFIQAKGGDLNLTKKVILQR